VACILDYLSEFEGTIVLRDGAPYLSLPKFPCNRYGVPVRRDPIVKEVTPHLKARRAELIERLAECRESFVGEGPVRFVPWNMALLTGRDAGAIDLPGKIRERNRLVCEVQTRAMFAQKAVYWCVVPGAGKPRVGTVKLRKRRKTDNLKPDVPDSATLVCVEGDSQWTALPKIVPDPEPWRGKRKTGRQSESSGEWFTASSAD
jgi:hypothetical protein